MKKARVALITHDFAMGGGTATMTRFLYQVLRDSSDYSPGIVSLATSTSDRASVLLTKPASWLSSPRTIETEVGGIPCHHAGTRFPELEFRRYAPRESLKRLLAEFDILQYVVGIPAWACTAGERLRESVVWFATTARNDRASRVEQARGLRRLNYAVMTAAAENLEQRALGDAGRVVALSHYSADQVREHVPEGRLTMIPCGVDTAKFRPDPASSASYFLCVGRQSDPRKNLRLLLDSYQAAHAVNPEIPDLYLVGEPPAEETFSWIQNSSIASRVRILGLKRGDELAALYRGAHSLVVPSDEEGLGIVILEAMASGVPVVSTRCGGPETSIADGVNGYLVPTGNRPAFRDAILRIAADRDLRDRLGAAALLRAQEMFSLKAVGDQFLKLYERMPRRS